MLYMLHPTKYTKRQCIYHMLSHPILHSTPPDCFSASRKQCIEINLTPGMEKKLPCDKPRGGQDDVRFAWSELVRSCLLGWWKCMYYGMPSWKKGITSRWIKTWSVLELVTSQQAKCMYSLLHHRQHMYSKCSIAVLLLLYSLPRAPSSANILLLGYTGTTLSLHLSACLFAPCLGCNFWMQSWITIPTNVSMAKRRPNVITRRATSPYTCSQNFCPGLNFSW